MGKWEEIKLDDGKITELIMGQSPPSKTYNTEKIGLPFFQGKKEFGELYPTVEKWCSKPNKIAEPGDVLLSVRAPVGPTNLAFEKCCIGRGLASIRPNTELLLTKFLLYYFHNFELEISAKGQGSTFKAISGKELRKLEIPLPPLPEQKRIVAKLDGLFEKIDQAISLLEENIADTEALMGSVLDEEFGKLKLDFENIALDQVLKIKSGGFLSSKKMSNTNEYNVYGGNGINGTHNIFNLEDENIVIGRVGAKCGNVRLVKGTIWVTDNAFYVSEIKKDISKEFLLETLRLLNLGETANQAAQPVISFKGIRNLTMPIPDRENQKSFCVKSQTLREKTNLIIGSQTQKLNHLKALKSSLLDRAFKGEL